MGMSYRGWGSDTSLGIIFCIVLTFKIVLVFYIINQQGQGEGDQYGIQTETNTLIPNGNITTLKRTNKKNCNQILSPSS